MTGMYEFDLFKDLDKAGVAEIHVDLLAGNVTGSPSADLIEAARRAPVIMADLCRRQGGRIDEFTEVSVRFWTDPIDARFDVTVADRHGRKSTLEYSGRPARRLTVLDQLGRLRPKPPANDVRLGAQ